MKEIEQKERKKLERKKEQRGKRRERERKKLERKKEIKGNGARAREGIKTILDFSAYKFALRDAMEVLSRQSYE